MGNNDYKNRRINNHNSNGLGNQVDDSQNISSTIIEYLKKICPATKNDVIELQKNFDILNDKLEKLESAIVRLTNGVNNTIDPSDGILGKILAILNEDGRRETEKKEKEIGEIDVNLKNIIDVIRKIWTDFNSDSQILLLVVDYFERVLKNEDSLQGKKQALIDVAKEKEIDVCMILQDIEQIKNNRDSLEQITGQKISDFIIKPQKGDGFDKNLHEETPFSYIRCEGIPEDEKVIDEVIVFGININEKLDRKKAIVTCIRKDSL